jgi:hypothetical protein
MDIRDVFMDQGSGIISSAIAVRPFNVKSGMVFVMVSDRDDTISAKPPVERIVGKERPVSRIILRTIPSV